LLGDGRGIPLAGAGRAFFVDPAPFVAFVLFVGFAGIAGVPSREASV
jgi:hypothetical protein